MKSLAAKTLLGIVSTVVVLGVLECIVRVTGIGVHAYMTEIGMYGRMLVPDEQGHYLRHPAGASVVSQGVTLSFNSLGMRDDEPQIPKPPGTFRVLCLGDSVTMGPAVPHDLIFPTRLRALLGPGVDVVTAAVAGWNTVSEERFLAAHIAELAPDLVVLLYVANDNEPTEPFRRVQDSASRGSTRLYRTLVLESRLFEWAAFVYQAHSRPDAQTLRRLAAWNRKQTVVEEAFTEKDRGWLRSRSALDRIRILCDEHGARLVIFVLNQLNRTLEQRVLARIREFGVARGVPVFDTWPFVAGHKPLSLMNNNFIDPHWNAEGHRLYAAGIARTLRAEALVPGFRSGAPAAADP